MVISFRIKNFNKEEEHKLFHLLKQGFPKKIFTELENEERLFFEKLHKDEVEEYRYARTILGESKQVSGEINTTK